MVCPFIIKTIRRGVEIMNKKNGIKLTKKELLRMSKDLNMDVNELIKYLTALEDNGFTKLGKDNVLRVVR